MYVFLPSFFSLMHIFQVQQGLAAQINTVPLPPFPTPQEAEFPKQSATGQDFSSGTSSGGIGLKAAYGGVVLPPKHLCLLSPSYVLKPKNDEKS
jgi:hypothetical protein